MTRPTHVRKRDGQTTPFDMTKIIAAVRGAWVEVHGDNADDAKIKRVAGKAADALEDETVDVETVQDAVELALMRAKEFEVAKAFIVYRQRRAEDRAAAGVAPDANAIGQYIHASKYARFRPDLLRRELYVETVARVEDMHLRRFAHLGDDFTGEIRWAFDQVRDRRVLPSMRSMQFGGAAIEACENRLFNCSFSLIDRPRAFAEAMFLLLAGCGVGYSVQFRHVEKLPSVQRQTGEVVHHVVGDTIEGWADAVHALVVHTMHGRWVEFAYHQVRDKGAPLKTSGGRAPGHVPLRKALEAARTVLLDAQGRQLRPIECHRMLCRFADAVLSGGIRRSAMIALFSVDDGEMMSCKAFDGWWDKEPYLARANNSVVLLRSEANEEQFKRVFKMTRNFGEPGFAFVEDCAHGLNPCAEVGLEPEYHTGNSVLTGWAFCNLTTINAAALRSEDDFMSAARAATLIGTLQASYTDFPYLGSVSEAIAKRDALLGVSMTGIQDSPCIALNHELQRKVSMMIPVWNAEYAAKIGINPAARTTCVKPEGTSSLELSCEASPAVGSGIHPHPARRYIRRVTAEENEPPFQAFRAANPGMCQRKPDGNWVIEFPVKVGDDARLRDDSTALEFLEQVRQTHLNWVLPGTARESAKPGLRHNVSNTVNVREHEWDEVADYVWNHRADFTAVSFLPHDGDVIYPFAPFESVRTPEQERRWRELAAIYKPVDYSSIREDEDATNLSGEVACAGGACSL